MNILHTSAKVVLTVIFALPLLGLSGIFPPPTADMYSNPAAFEFIQLLMGSALYIEYMMVGTLLLAGIALWTRREALAALLALPITAHVIGFHLFLDGGLLNAGSIPALTMLALNMYFIYKNKDTLKVLIRPKTETE